MQIEISKAVNVEDERIVTVEGRRVGTIRKVSGQWLLSFGGGRHEVHDRLLDAIAAVRSKGQEVFAS